MGSWCLELFRSMYRLGLLGQGKLTGMEPAPKLDSNLI